MTKTQALAMMNALEAHTMNASAVMTFLSGVESWTVKLDPQVVYTGAQLDALYQYCAANSLTLSAQFTSLGVV